MASIMLGIDIKKNDILLRIWNEEHSHADFYRPATAASDDPEKTIKQKLEERLGAIRSRYGGATFARIGITGERMDEKAVAEYTAMFKELGYDREKLYFASHADALAWYEITENCADRSRISMAVDYCSDGMRAHILHPMLEVKNSPFFVESIDYSEMMRESLDDIEVLSERVTMLKKMTNIAIGHRDVARLYITAKCVDFNPGDDENKPELTALGSFFTATRKVFAGTSLYSQGACYMAAREKIGKPVIMDRQIYHNVYLDAYKEALSGPVKILSAGTYIDKATEKLQVIMDDTDEITIKAEDLRTGATQSFSVKTDMPQRENKTIRYEVTVSFLDCTTLVIKLRDVGFGDIYPASYRIWEQLIKLNQ